MVCGVVWCCVVLCGVVWCCVVAMMVGGWENVLDKPKSCFVFRVVRSCGRELCLRRKGCVQDPCPAAAACCSCALEVTGSTLPFRACRCCSVYFPTRVQDHVDLLAKDSPPTLFSVECVSTRVARLAERLFANALTCHFFTEVARILVCVRIRTNIS